MSAIDAIIVLGNLMSAEGRLNIESSSRAAYAAGIYHQLGGVPIITCGWRYRSDTSLSLAQAMQNCLHHTHGVATSQYSDLFLDTLFIYTSTRRHLLTAIRRLQNRKRRLHVNLFVKHFKAYRQAMMQKFLRVCNASILITTERFTLKFFRKRVPLYEIRLLGNKYPLPLPCS
ncbi:MAG: hypothetical protein P8176_10835 [Gammaproteobacteria bacterium]